jgi:probable selenium-dependent hydroxylase accessory protein YqeC
VSLVGAGGKTSLMYRLVAELRASGVGAVAATTTRIAPPAPGEPALLCAETWEELARRLGPCPWAVVARRRLPADKVEGVPPDWCDRIRREGLAGALVVEADGSARKPVKAPESWEPVVPPSSTLFVAVVGLSCVGESLDGDHAHRPERISAVTGVPPGARLTPDSLARLLASEEGLLRGRPLHARAAAFLNQADVPGGTAAGREIAGLLLGEGRSYERVVVGSLREASAPLEVFVAEAAPPPRAPVRG